MSRIESGSLKVNRKPEDIEDVIGSSILQVRRKYGNRAIRTIIPQGLPLVDLDFVLISQACANILDNAIKYSPPGAEVEVGVRTFGSELVVSGQPQAGAGDLARTIRAENRDGGGTVITISLPLRPEVEGLP